MSADNYMAVKNIAGQWHVWMVLGGYYRDDWAKPGGYMHDVFEDKLEALEYAHDVCSKEVVEYGVVIVPDEFDIFIDGIGVVDE